MVETKTILGSMNCRCCKEPIQFRGYKAYKRAQHTPPVCQKCRFELPPQITDQRFHRVCRCGVQITYTSELSFEIASKLNAQCESCTEKVEVVRPRIAREQKPPLYFRNCPRCNREQKFVSYMGFFLANKKNTLCRSCGWKKNSLKSC